MLFAPLPNPLPQEKAASANPDPSGQKIGLVLEGGGALGLAHIGVIQWLEEHRIPVSYVAGTSMGGLIGGVYATGRSPAEVRELVSTIPWNTVLRGQVPFQNLTFRRKEDSYIYPGSIEFGLKKGLQFRSGFNSGQEVQFILDRVALPYSTMQSFNDMPIPFACVATDLITSKPYVFRSGSLATALRSTMSLPGFFSPVRADGQVFADGGLLDNLPVDVAKEMGAQIILAVHLETQPMSPDESLSSFGVLGRSISVTIAANEMRSMEQADLLLTVPLQKYNGMDYEKSVDLIQAGYQAAQAKAAMLIKLSVDDATWQSYLAERASRRRQTVPAPQFIDVAGTDPRSAKAIEKEFAPQIGEPVNTQALQNQILNVQGDGRYSSLNYAMVEKNDEPGLLVTAEEKSYAPPIVRPQITIDGSQYNNVLFSIGGRITMFNVGSYGSELRNDVIAGSEYGIRTEYYHPFVPGSNFFIAPQALFDSTEFNAYNSSGSLASIYRVRQGGGGFDLGYILGRSSEIRVGYIAEYVRYSLQVGEDTEPTVSGREGFARFQYRLLHVDDPVIPTTGQLANFRTQYFDAYPQNVSVGAATVSTGIDQHFPLVEGKLTQFVPLTDRTTVFFAGGGGTTAGNNTIGLPVFSLGGLYNFAAYGANEILTDEYAIGQIGYLRDLKRLPPFLGNKLYLYGRFEAGTFLQAASDPQKYRIPGDAAAGLLVNTIFGPVLIGGAVGDAGHHRFFFGLGRTF
jgi:NTE family protein